MSTPSFHALPGRCPRSSTGRLSMSMTNAGIIADTPVRAFRDGTYMTGAYSRGKLALRGPEGEILDVLGKGPGNGPGEFDHATGLVLG